MIEALVKESVKNLLPYQPHHYPHKYKLDANESPFFLPSEMRTKILKSIENIDLNRYPDTDALELKLKLGKYINITPRNIIVGNGSDELIQLIINTFVEKDEVILSHSPTFAMYKISGTVFGAKYMEVSTDEEFNINVDSLINGANTNKAKIIFICTPNNPTGKVVKKADLIRVINETNAIVVVDEAYGEFGGESCLRDVLHCERLIVLRTFSKALGAAGIRLGYLIANNGLIRYLNMVKHPYNLNAITQVVGKALLDKSEVISERVAEIKEQREILKEEMSKMAGVKIYSTEANFILFKVDHGKKVFEGLLERGIMVRFFKGSPLENHLRVTVGSSIENIAFINALKEVI